ncbi:aldehyde dehydrogenase family protein [Clostridium beijerinckii]|jgi:NAD-dependent aldehyde dehydrogenases|uniref:Aldehyde dehydrogenase EutE n=2 Tax=Clostridium beijerinckii TaxID=1520 RepID=A0A1S8R1T1_CLOBE|nr:aldehyde dehydrogenase family protein [Clostridium beijerinckii]ABR36155.1 aldehyde dehydrogenase [Clostridium beijerinckii NCIMB 8052]AIU01736.1 aldehyde dehydrogenase [Clostridium beijerinckii ATCC 35702]MBF7809197.1 aldehyde dehydrogenase EutE [Clostridium beijerinckii]NOW89692.1 propionaldehyde dehydrogenase [Clostridium beijerinckii]NRT22787.1 propionaldehyde dehydrogenase [Clostridium beijerinckii]
MDVDVVLVEKLVRQAIEEVKNKNLLNLDKFESVKNYGIFGTMDAAVEASFVAQKQLLNASMTDKQKYVDTIKATILKKENLELISRMSVEETEIGKYEHKLIKNRVAAEKTPGIEDLTTEAMTGDNGLTLVEYCPFGVIGAITPTTNPTETIICNSISMIAGGNTVVFSPHPRAKNVSIKLVTMLNKALEEAGAPDNLIATVKEPSIENTNIMMEHPKIRMLVATGGPAIVNKVMSTGKKAIGAGAGNPPVVVDETADIEKAAIDIVNGCSFDNNVPCIAEKEVFAVDQICDYLIHYMKLNGAYEIKDRDLIQKLLDLVTNENGGPKVSFVGKSAPYILNKLGISVDENIKVIIMEVEKNHHFVLEEMMMPILPIVRTKDVDEAIECAYVAEHGNRHTAIMHSKNVDKLTKMARLLETTIFVKNAPSYAGIGVGGEGTTTFTIAGPTGEGLTTARSFCRKRRCVMVDAFNIR